MFRLHRGTRALLVAAILSLATIPAHAQQPPPKKTPPPSAQNREPAGDEGDDDDVVRVDTDLATVLLTAIDRDRRFVTTLKREDIRVLEDNVAQELSVFDRETDMPLTFAVLVDTSRSQQRTLSQEKTAALAFINSFLRPDRDKAAVVSFTGIAVLQQGLTNDLGKLRDAVGRVRIEFPEGAAVCEKSGTERELRCHTGIWDAVWMAVSDVLSQTPEPTRRAIILLTDGEDTSSMIRKEEAIDFAVKQNVVIYSIGIGDDEKFEIADDALTSVAEKTGGRVYFPTDQASLYVAFEQIQQELSSQYLLAYRPSNMKRDGNFRRVRVEIVNPELRKQKLQLLYRQGYYARSGAPPAGRRK